MAKQEFNPDMVATMKKNKSKSVFINEEGAWLFHKTEGFKEYSRKEVTGADLAPEPKKEAKTAE